VIRGCTLAFVLVAAAAADERDLRYAPAYKRLDQFVARHMRENNTPGIAVAITDRERLLSVRSYGFANLMTRTSVTARTVFPIGSISKAFTAVALLQLQEAGKVDLDAPAARYLPWLQVNSPYVPFTIHHLLSHTAGLPSDRDDLPSTLYSAFASQEQAVAFAPGERFVYSNVGYQVLGRIIEAMAGMPLAEVQRAGIFEPLGMTDSVGSITNAHRNRMAAGYPVYYDDRPFHSSQPVASGPWVEWDSGDGNVAVSAIDLAAFLRMLLNRGAGPRGRILSEKSFGLMTQHAVKVRDGLHYGYGMSIRENAVLAHSGGMVGYTAMLLADPHEGIGVAVLTNGGACDPDVVAGFVLELVRASLRRHALSAAPLSPAVVSNAPDYAGVYVSPTGKKLTLIAESDGLMLRHTGRKIVLEKRGDDRFYVNHPDFALFLLEFRREGNAVAEAFHGSDWYPSSRYRGPKTFDYPPQWNSYLGHYRSYNPWLSNFRVVLRKGQLLFVSPDGDTRVLVPRGLGLFQIGEAQTASRLRLDTMINGKAQRADFLGSSFYKTLSQ
jgi:D-alanyl-D-alanine carboxypeptidase